MMAVWLRRQLANWRSHLASLLMVVGVVFAVQFWQTRDVSSAAVPDVPMVVLMPDGSRTVTTLRSLVERHGGVPVALHVWADWCPICKAEEGTITSLARDWPVITVAMQSGDAAKVASVLRQRELPWVTALDSRGEFSQQIGFRAVPAFAVIDADGRLRMPAVGYTTSLGMRLRLWWVRLTA
jgi:thiol-disulfide isomerase/thioredoxin